MLSRTRIAPVTRSASRAAVGPVAPCAAMQPRTVSVVLSVMTRNVPSSVIARTTLSPASVTTNPALSQITERMTWNAMPRIASAPMANISVRNGWIAFM